MGFFDRLKSGLTKTRDNFVSGLDSLFSGFSEIDDDFYEELEEILIMADIGVVTTDRIIEDLKEKVKEQKIKDPSECKELLIRSIKDQMQVGEEAARMLLQMLDEKEPGGMLRQVTLGYRVLERGSI